VPLSIRLFSLARTDSWSAYPRCSRGPVRVQFVQTVELEAVRLSDVGSVGANISAAGPVHESDTPGPRSRTSVRSPEERTCTAVNSMSSTRRSQSVMRCVPAADKMSAVEVLHEWLGSSQADKDGWGEAAAEAGIRGAAINIPRRRRINGGYRKPGVLQSLNDRWKRFTDLPGEAEA